MHTPYANPALDAVYNGLFCDDPSLLIPATATSGAARTLTAEPPDVDALRALALAPDSEARIAALAWRRLQRIGQPVPSRELLGVVIEVPLQTGLDTLAAYRDGSVRFIHGSGHTAIIEAPSAAVTSTVERLLAASQAVVDCIGPTLQPRRPAPRAGVRMSFVVSDGLYFGEGPMQALMADAMAGPVLHAGVALLNRVTTLVAMPA